jgi:hypothetical protein
MRFDGLVQGEMSCSFSGNHERFLSKCASVSVRMAVCDDE